MICMLYLSQHILVHWKQSFVPSYQRVVLTKETDYETIFVQTGLGREAVKKLVKEGNFQKILDMQELFFLPPQTECRSLVGWITKEDRIKEERTVFIDLQPGDILVTLSTHTLGIRHGHAGLVIDENTVLECGVIGEKSALCSVDYWTSYSNYAVLRIKNITQKEQKFITDYAQKALKGVPYHLSAGFIGPKDLYEDSPLFGLQCAYLVWYAWNRLGYDVDSDGGRLVLPKDLLYAECLEVVQVYGMDPRLLIASEKCN